MRNYPLSTALQCVGLNVGPEKLEQNKKMKPGTVINERELTCRINCRERFKLLNTRGIDCGYHHRFIIFFSLTSSQIKYLSSIHGGGQNQKIERNLRGWTGNLSQFGRTIWFIYYKYLGRSWYLQKPRRVLSLPSKL